MGNRKLRGVSSASRGRASAASIIFFLLFPPFLLSPVLVGCAAPGEPYERKPPTPAAVGDLSAEQSGNDVVLTFTMPQQTVDRRTLQETPEIEIYRNFQGIPAAGQPNFSAPVNPTLLVAIPAATQDRYVEQGHVHYADSLRPEDFTQHPDSEAIYIVRTLVSEKKPSANSNVAALRVYPALDAIGDLKAEVTHSGIVLTWTAPSKTLAGTTPPIAGYSIYRGKSEAGTAGGENTQQKSPLVKIGETQSVPYQDLQFQFGNTYAYSVRSVVQHADKALESANSNLAVVTARDTFPPATPQGLLVVLVPRQGDSPAHFELSWSINSETDLAGYSVYRSEEAGNRGNRLNTELLLTPAFRDMNVQPGHRYFYSVTALDHAGNESSQSAVVSNGVPAESQATP